jgi:hypothetical protein
MHSASIVLPIFSKWRWCFISGPHSDWLWHSLGGKGLHYDLTKGRASGQERVGRLPSKIASI